MSGPATLDRSSAYRRQARQIRGRLVHKPVERYLALRHLSDRHDACPSHEIHASQTGGQASAFATIVSEHVGDRVLSYSDRLRLLGVARRLGVGRFEANLIIAAVQHRSAGSRSSLSSPPAPGHLRLAGLLTFVVLQSLILVSLWGIFLR